MPNGLKNSKEEQKMAFSLDIPEEEEVKEEVTLEATPVDDEHSIVQTEE